MLRDDWEVEWIAPGHYKGEPAFEILKGTSGDQYIYAGPGTTVALGANSVGAAEEHNARAFFDEADLRTYHALSVAKPEHHGFGFFEGHDQTSLLYRAKFLHAEEERP